jgi:hypothetical protein
MRKILIMVLLSTLAMFTVPFTRVGLSSRFQGTGLDSFEQQVVGSVNGTRARSYALKMENISYQYPAFRAAGSPGANDTANWIKGQFESFGLVTSLEPFQFTNWTLLSEPSLVIDKDGNSSTVNDQDIIGYFEPEHYSWPTPDSGIFAKVEVLPLPPANNFDEIGINSINTTEWNLINTTGKILLIGREIRWNDLWQQTFVDKLTLQSPAAVVYSWWYNWMNFTPPMFSSTGGKPFSNRGSYYWDLHVPVGSTDYYSGIWIRNAKLSNPELSANVTIRSVMGQGVHYNVVGQINGYTNPEKMVIISGHYDTVMDSGFCDNAAGTSGVMELAEVFAKAAQQGIYQPNYTLVFVAFTGEELDLVGSINYVKLHKSEMSNIIAVINLDCIGSADLYVTETEPAGGFDLDGIVSGAAQDLGISINTEPAGGSDQETFRIPFDVNSWYQYYWGLDAGISDATPVVSSAMIDSYPLFYNDLWNMGTAGWIHTSYDNSTSTETLNWVETSNLQNHIMVAALTIMRVSPNAVIPEFASGIILTLLMVIAASLCVALNKKKVASGLRPNCNP